jgi:hypothetical protein
MRRSAKTPGCEPSFGAIASSLLPRGVEERTAETTIGHVPHGMKFTRCTTGWESGAARWMLGPGLWSDW